MNLYLMAKNTLNNDLLVFPSNGGIEFKYCSIFFSEFTDTLVDSNFTSPDNMVVLISFKTFSQTSSTMVEPGNLDLREVVCVYSMTASW